jgi:hypothetical protein
MGFRFRLGPFTFGRSGIRVSLWSRGTGVSVPLSGKGESFGKVSVGPVSWYSERSAKKESTPPPGDESGSRDGETFEHAAILAFQADHQFLQKVRKYGVPWRAIQEHLKGMLPEKLSNPDEIAYRLVPKVLEATFGQQGIAWSTESRPSKSGAGKTTWVIVK